MKIKQLQREKTNNNLNVTTNVPEASIVVDEEQKDAVGGRYTATMCESGRATQTFFGENIINIQVPIFATNANKSKRTLRKLHKLIDTISGNKQGKANSTRKRSNQGTSEQLPAYPPTTQVQNSQQQNQAVVENEPV